MLSFTKKQELSPLFLIMSTIVVASLLFIVTRISTMRVRRENFAAMKADAMSGGVAHLDKGALPSSDSRLYSDYFIEMS